MPDVIHPLHPPTLRPTNSNSYEPILARVKPKVQRLQLAIPLETSQGDVQGGRFSNEQAELFRRGLDVKDLGSDKNAAEQKRQDRATKTGEFLNSDDAIKRLSKITLKGQVVPDQTNYCVGHFVDGIYLSLSHLCGVGTMLRV